MAELHMKKTIRGRLKNQTYWQAVLRFGLPFMILYRGTNYLFFRVGTHSVEPHRWLFFLILDVAVMFTVSTMWWIFWRETAPRKRED